jgi:hypothetical protein
MFTPRWRNLLTAVNAGLPFIPRNYGFGSFVAVERLSQHVGSNRDTSNELKKTAPGPACGVCFAFGATACVQ